jgi:dihydroorotate dehydrogenase (NAD+) catalytic subunit
VALAAVHTCFRTTRLPIVGMGGVATGRHAVELLAAGASDVAVGTALFSDPGAASRIRSELAAELAALGFAEGDNAVGLAHGEDASTLDPRSRVVAQKALHT